MFCTDLSSLGLFVPPHPCIPICMVTGYKKSNVLNFIYMKIKRLLLKSLCKTCYYRCIRFLSFTNISPKVFPIIVSLWGDSQGRKFTFIYKLQSTHGKHGTAKQLSLKQAKKKSWTLLRLLLLSLGYASHETLPDIYLILFFILVCLLSFPMNGIKKKSKLITKSRGRVSRKLADRVGRETWVKERGNSQSLNAFHLVKHSFCYELYFLPFSWLFSICPFTCMHSCT